MKVIINGASGAGGITSEVSDFKARNLCLFYSHISRTLHPFDFKERSAESEVVCMRNVKDIIKRKLFASVDLSNMAAKSACVPPLWHDISLSVGWSVPLFHIEISQQLLDEMPSHFLEEFMVPKDISTHWRDIIEPPTVPPHVLQLYGGSVLNYSFTFLIRKPKGLDFFFFFFVDLYCKEEYTGLLCLKGFLGRRRHQVGTPT